MAGDVLFVDIYGAVAESKTNFPKRDNEIYCIVLVTAESLQMCRSEFICY